jgi:hypothetical protein
VYTYFYCISRFVFLKENGHNVYMTSWWRHQASKESIDASTWLRFLAHACTGGCALVPTVGWARRRWSSKRRERTKVVPVLLCSSARSQETSEPKLSLKRNDYQKFFYYYKRNNYKLDLYWLIQCEKTDSG